MAVSRRLPIGTELVDSTSSGQEPGAHVRVWAPDHAKVTMVIESDPPRDVVLTKEPDGHHSGDAPGAVAGTRYRFRLGNDETLYPDPASRFQPDGPFGPSEIIDPGAFTWTDQAWKGVAPDRHVLYELHLGTFTPEGTWAAAAQWLDYLAELGITTIEVMPVAEFAGKYGWGYDGVDLFAPFHHYGTPDDARRFVDQAHAKGLAVILDVVYNHFGPAGNYMFTWSPHYKSDRTNEWGDTLNYDGEGSLGMRELVIANAGYWIDEFHLDGLRLDATQAIHDRSERHVLGEAARKARGIAPDRHIFFVGENEPQDAALLGDEICLDALWNDDFHHAARVTLTGIVDGYLHDYRGTAQEYVSAIKRGFLFQGQLFAWQKNPRGTPTRGLERRRFVHFLDNHDQASNFGYGERMTVAADAGVLRALTALLLLTPELPMLFQGQEYGAPQPWRFFVDHSEDLHEPIRSGRAKFMAQFPAMGTDEAQAALYNPNADEAFRECILDPRERRLDTPWGRLHKELLALRRDDPAFTDSRPEALDGAVLSPQVFVLRYFQDDPTRDRLLLVNLGATFAQPHLPEPLLAPPGGSRDGWRIAWSSEDPRYGGHGTPVVFNRHRLAIPARSAVLLVPDRAASIYLDLTLEEANRPPDV
ncbi:MAG TPA: malto-oligosyltrehalose trehalohydrolase [Kofleriaceae bacterium]